MPKRIVYDIVLRTKEATESAGEFEESLGKFSPALANARSRIRQLTSSTRAFRAALMATGIGAVVAALAGLIQAFRSTQEGADRINRVLVPLRSVMEALWGVVQDLSLSIGDGLTQAFRDPRQAIMDLGDMLMQNIINRFRAVIEIGGSLGRLLKGIATLDLQMIKEATIDYADGMVQLTTGIENASEKILNFGQDIAQTSREAFEAGQRIQELNEQIRQVEIEQVGILSQMRREYQELRTLVGDTMRSEQERLQAIEDAEVLLRRKQDEQMRLLDLEIERLELQQSLNDTSAEEELELQKLLARREELEAQTIRDLRSFDRRRASIEKGLQREQEEREKQHREEMQQLEERADAFRDLLLTEQQLQQRAFDEQLSNLQELHDKGIISQEEFNHVRAEMERQFNEQALEEEEERIGSILHLEKQLQEARTEFRQATSDEDRQRHRERMTELEEQIERMMEVREENMEGERMSHEELMSMIRERHAMTMQAMNQVSQLSQAISQRRISDIDNERRRELEQIDAAMKRRDLSEDQREELLERRQSIEEAHNQRIAEERQRQARAQKRWNTAQAIMNTAIAITEAMPNPFQMAFAAAMGAIQIATIRQQPVPQFATGGMIGGRRHSAGGTIIEAEQGEFIVNREATAQNLPLLQNINESRAPRLQDGGRIGTANDNLMDTDLLISAIHSLGRDVADMRFEIDLVTATDKISKQQRTNQRRRTIAI
jgi:hypothetical protein